MRVSPFFRLVALTAINHLCFSSVRLGVALYAVHLHASLATVGILMGIFGLLSAITSVSAGRWIDRVGPRMPMLVASASMVAGAGLAFVWRDIAALYVVSAVVGTLFNVYFIAYQPLVGEYGTPAERVKNFSIASVGISISSFIAPLITGFSIDHLGHPETFLLVAMLPLIPLVVIGSGHLPFPMKKKHEKSTGTGSGEKSMWRLLRNPELRRIYAVSLVLNITWNLFSFLIPLYCIEIGLSASSIGVVVGCYALASITSRMMVAPMSRYLTPWQTLIISGCIAGLCFAGFALVHTFLALAVLSFCLGLGLGMATPTSQAMLYEIAPSNRIGEVMGLRTLMGNSMQTVVPLLSGAIGAALGLSPIFWALAATQVAVTYVVRKQWLRQRMRRTT